MVDLGTGRTPERVKRIVSKYFTNGSTTNAIGDYSSTPSTFHLTPPSDETWIITELSITIGGTGSLRADQYAIITLTNGFDLCITQNSITWNYNDDHTIKRVVDLAEIGHDIVEHSYGAGENFVSQQIDFHRSESNLLLDGSRGDKIEITLSDNFSGLTDHVFVAQGYKQ